ncbi:hypothetical protein Cri9333_4990 (plasmid) [Crinalium epipsammum PCC 9333]|uniref:Uncharacterized protein n=1 Tax=Crinalium epipsammum PCC 9333 TaxID=1173022 RepID=K9W8D7_9CYAN|nr:hypothetical protein [Crinalium epipsammum]AFZ15745.1 hypothetical protein Cri9333_4990 [Crinalium epipsammum PCC 9333]
MVNTGVAKFRAGRNNAVTYGYKRLVTIDGLSVVSGLHLLSLTFSVISPNAVLASLKS